MPSLPETPSSRPKELVSAHLPPLPAHVPRDPALDGLRGVAVLLVFLFHYGGGLRSSRRAVRAFGYLSQSGWVGVEIFFVLSGFLITALLWRDLGRAQARRNFYGRRALRILPLYYAALLVAAVAALARGAAPHQLRPLLVYAGFLQNLPTLVPLALHTPGPVPLDHLWSLAVEEQFYLLWPFLLLLARTRRRALTLSLALFAISCALRAVIFLPGLCPGIDPANWAPLLPIRGGGLALGAALALTVPLRKPGRQGARAALLLSGTVFLTVGVALHSVALNQPSHFLYSLPAVQVAATSLLALALQPGLLRKLLSLAALRFMGRISYGVYVLHIVLEPLFDRIGFWTTHTHEGTVYQLVRLVAGLPITVALALLSFRMLETPFLRLKRLFPESSPLPAEWDGDGHFSTRSESARIQRE